MGLNEAFVDSDYVKTFFLLTGELPGQMLSFAANTIYMAISCSNLQPKTEPGATCTTGERLSTTSRGET